MRQVPAGTPDCIRANPPASAARSRSYSLRASYLPRVYSGLGPDGPAGGVPDLTRGCRSNHAGYFDGDKLTGLHKPLAEAERSQERAFDLFGHGDGELADVRLLETVRLCGDFGPGYGATWQRSHARHWAVRLTGRLALGRKTRGPSISDVLLVRPRWMACASSSRFS